MGKTKKIGTLGRCACYAVILAVLGMLAGKATAQCECPADLDETGSVGFNDLSLLLGNWGICDEGVPCPWDIDGTDSVGFNDLSVLLGTWGLCPEFVDTDGDTVPDCVDQCPGEDDLLDSDGDLTPDCLDGCPDDPNKTDPGDCGCGVADDDTDGDTVPDCVDQCPGEDDLLDSDGDLTPDCLDGCPDDPNKTDPGDCGCGVADDDTDGDTVPDCVDQCPGEDDLLDSDGDLTPDCLDGCPDDPDKTDPGVCGCGTPDTDSDSDGVPDCEDLCPGQPDGLDTDKDGVPDCLDQCPGEDDTIDTDGDLTPDCLDGCPDDPDKTEPGACGCGVPDDDTDGDTVPDCVDVCPGEDDTIDSDGDLTPDCLDGCPDDPDKTEPGLCGCGTPDDDTDGDTVPDCVDICPGEDDLLDSDGDLTPDCLDGCPGDPDKTDPGVCGCGTPDDDTDGDTVPDCVDQCPGEDDLLDTDGDLTPDCLDGCPGDRDKTDPGVCGCDVPDDDADGDTVPDCVDQCPGEDDLLDTDGDETPDCLDGCPDDPNKTEPGECGCGVPDTPGCETAVIFSDDFNRCTPDPQWNEVDVLGGATFHLMGAGTSDAQLAITVPAGPIYEAWIDNTAARLMQPTGDVDFQVVAKFDSRPSVGFQEQGIIVEQIDGTFLRAEFLSTNSALNLFVATLTDFSPSILRNANITANVAPSGPLWLRVTRTGDLWTVEYSDDGATWQGFAQTTDFLYDITVTQVGPHCGSDGVGYTALVDYFFDTASPINPEDGAIVGDEQYTISGKIVGEGGVSIDPPVQPYACGTTVTLTAIPEVGWEFIGWTGDVNSIENPLVFQAMSDLDITVNFAAAATAPQIRGIGVIPTDDAAVITWSTDLLATSVLHTGKSTGYELPPISYDAYTTSHTAVLLGLEPGTTYHFQILVESEMGDVGRTLDLTFTTLPRAERGQGRFGEAGARPDRRRRSSGGGALGR